MTVVHVMTYEPYPTYPTTSFETGAWKRFGKPRMVLLLSLLLPPMMLSLPAVLGWLLAGWLAVWLVGWFGWLVGWFA